MDTGSVTLLTSIGSLLWILKKHFTSDTNPSRSLLDNFHNFINPVVIKHYSDATGY